MRCKCKRGEHRLPKRNSSFKEMSPDSLPPFSSIICSERQEPQLRCAAHIYQIWLTLPLPLPWAGWCHNTGVTGWWLSSVPAVFAELTGYKFRLCVLICREPSPCLVSSVPDAHSPAHAGHQQCGMFWELPTLLWLHTCLCLCCLFVDLPFSRGRFGSYLYADEQNEKGKGRVCCSQ